MSITFSILKGFFFTVPRMPVREGREAFAVAPGSLERADDPGPGGTKAGDMRPALCRFRLSACPSALGLAGLSLFVFSVCFELDPRAKKKKKMKENSSKWLP